MNQNLSGPTTPTRPADTEGHHDGACPAASAMQFRPQMYPRLTQADIDRIRAFGTRRAWRANEFVVRTGRHPPTA